MISLKLQLLIKLQEFQTSSLQNNPETKEEEILRERYIFREQRQKIIDDPILI